jgi:hypothetical protein
MSGAHTATAHTATAHTTEAIVVSRTYTADAVFKKEGLTAAQYAADAAFERLDIPQTYPLTSVFALAKITEYDIDVAFATQKHEQYDADTVFSKEISRQILGAHSHISHTEAAHTTIDSTRYDLSSIFEKLNAAATYLTSTVFQLFGIATQYDTDAVFEKLGKIITYTTSSIFEKLNAAATYLTSTVFQKERSTQYTVQSNFALVKASTYGLDAIFTKDNANPLEVDLYVRGALEIDLYVRSKLEVDLYTG